ncbi:MBL fold metallo-hydrolase [Nocardia altamirensis]|uniref:MBL fold metallo-hydrolase n=1 Tax=Nocardia altamirensis TaxID=472158 RepID=UPI000840899A|nr:MBL fold metallo-hydrolase [Nocardia altamirensis]
MTETIERTTQLEALLVGGPTLRLRYAGRTFLTDPTFDEPGVYPGPVTLHKLVGPAVSAAEVGPVDIVLLSHDEHDDNLDHSGREFLKTVPTVLSTPGAAERIEGVRGLESWETATIDGIRVTAVPALHGPEGCEPLTGFVTGFVLQADGQPTVYVSGDNASVDLVGQIVERIGRIDIAVLFVGAANVDRFGDIDITLNAHTALKAAELLGDAVVVPVHGEGWAHFSETLERLEREFEYGGRAGQLRIPPLGKTVAV